VYQDSSVIGTLRANCNYRLGDKLYKCTGYFGTNFVGPKCLGSEMSGSCLVTVTRTLNYTAQSERVLSRNAPSYANDVPPDDCRDCITCRPQLVSDFRSDPIRVWGGPRVSDSWRVAGGVMLLVKLNRQSAHYLHCLKVYSFSWHCSVPPFHSELLVTGLLDLLFPELRLCYRPCRLLSAVHVIVLHWQTVGKLCIATFSTCSWMSSAKSRMWGGMGVISTNLCCYSSHISILWL